MVLAQKQTRRSVEQNKEPEINLHLHGQLIYDKGGKNIHWSNYRLFNMWCWGNWSVHAKNKTGPLSHTLSIIIKA